MNGDCRWCGGADVQRDLFYPQAGLSYLYCGCCGVLCADQHHGCIDYRRYNGKASDVRSARDARRLEASFSRAQQARYLLERVTKAIEDRFAGRFSLLDIGCGPGDLLAALRDCYPEATLDGIDPSETNVREAWERHRLSIQAGFWEGADRNSYDVITVFGNLMLHDSPRRSLEMAFRCLKPGGVLLFDFKNSQCTTRRLLRISKPLLRDGKRLRGVYRQAFHGMPWGLNDSAVRRALDDIGFSVRSSVHVAGRNGDLGEQPSLAIRTATWIDRLFGSGAWLLFAADKPRQSHIHWQAA